MAEARCEACHRRGRRHRRRRCRSRRRRDGPL